MRSRYAPPKLSKKETQKIYETAADDVARSVIGSVLLVLHFRKWHKDRIEKFFRDVVSVIDMPPAFGRYATDKDVRNFIQKQYGIDFEKVHLKIEVEK